MMPNGMQVHLSDPVAQVDELIDRERRRARYYERKRRKRRMRAWLRWMDRHENVTDLIDALFWTLVFTALAALALAVVIRG